MTYVAAVRRRTRVLFYRTARPIDARSPRRDMPQYGVGEATRRDEAAREAQQGSLASSVEASRGSAYSLRPPSRTLPLTQDGAEVWVGQRRLRREIEFRSDRQDDVVDVHQ